MSPSSTSSSATSNGVSKLTSTPDRTGAPVLQARGISVSYGDDPVVRDLDLDVAEGSFTVIIGPNACGKSTLLRALSRLMRPDAGEVLLDGRPLDRFRSKELARRLGLLAQSSIAPTGITVSDLVARGRYPHQRVFEHWSPGDEAAVNEAMEATKVTDLARRRVEDLSGGQRQRVWIAMVLAQQTPVMLLDEPTTFLDIAHQIEVLELCRELREEHGRTLVAVLHDLNQACRYASHLVAMNDGRIVAQGDPAEVVDAALIEKVFSLRCQVVTDPVSGTPLVVPDPLPRRTVT
ncbi:MAG: ABC transporter ATP-binding protein [Acidimicrobiales bacterium]|nr:ABC transporter ATP-binding protein [Acidimicrobiales bacterium]